MKEKIYKIISIVVSIMIVFTFLYSCGKVVNAAVPQNQIVTSHNGSWGSYDFTYVFHNKYYKLQDATGVPNSTLLNPKYFYTDDNITFKAISGTDLIANILNQGIGLILDPDNILNYINAFFDAIGPNHLDLTDSKYSQGGLYDNNDNFLGYCLNDITGCYYDGLTTLNYVTIPSQMVNNVKSFDDSQNYTVDYVTYYPLSNQYILNNLSTSYTQTQKDYISNNIGNYNICYNLVLYTNDGTNKELYVSSDNSASNYRVFTAVVNPVKYGISTNSGYWNNFMNKYKPYDNSLLATDMVDFFLDNWLNPGYKILFDIYSNNNDVITQGLTVNLAAQSMNTVQISGNIQLGFNSSNHFDLPFNSEFTIYRNQTVLDNLNNETYETDRFYTDKYLNYNSEDDNSYNTNISLIDNSFTNNSNIFNDSNDSYYNYYDNGYYHDGYTAFGN